MQDLTSLDSVRDMQGRARGIALTDLIDRLSLAQEPSRVLDEQVAGYFGELPNTFDPWGAMRVAPGLFVGLDSDDCRFVRRTEIRHYTDNLEDVLTLLPDGTDFTVFGKSGRRSSAVVETARGSRRSKFAGSGATPSIALLVAILRMAEGNATCSPAR
jgi:hypothetical protein